MKCASLLREAMWSMVSERSTPSSTSTTPPTPLDYMDRFARAFATYEREPDAGMSTGLPAHAEIVVIGGGIIGCSTAYHLARDHKADVVLIEQRQADRRLDLACGRPRRPAPLVGLDHAGAPLLGRSLQASSRARPASPPAGARPAASGSPATRTAGPSSAARRPRRIRFGLDMHLLSPAEAKAMWPLMEVDDLVGATLPAVRRPGEPVRHHPVARQGRAHARREALRGRRLHRLRRSTDGRVAGGRDRPGPRSPATRS